jgi:integrase/recombinase XerD
MAFTTQKWRVIMLINFLKEVEGYLALRRHLGYQLFNEAYVLRSFATFLISKKATHITIQLSLQFATKNLHSSQQQWAIRLGIIRQFAFYLSAVYPRTEVPSTYLLPYHYLRRRPYIYSKEEIVKLLQACLNFKHRDSLRKLSYYCILGLLVVSGMRPCEALSLNHDSIDFEAGIINISESKYLRSRRIPIHKTTISLLKDYALHRDKTLKTFLTKAFFVDQQGCQIKISSLREIFIKACIAIGLRNCKPKPRIMDLRHTFAVRILTEWHQKKGRIGGVAALLSKYLGHQRPESTYWYLTGTSELLALIQKKGGCHEVN